MCDNPDCDAKLDQAILPMARYQKLVADAARTNSQIDTAAILKECEELEKSINSGHAEQQLKAYRAINRIRAACTPHYTNPLGSGGE